MKQVLIKKGAVIVEEVPSPNMNDKEILVRVQYSCLSIGTEMSGIRNSAIPMWRKALQQPEKAMAAINMVSSHGINHTLNLIKEKGEATNPTGYSAAGVVVKVGSGINDIAIGDKVACAGAQCAYHAEFISVPRNLCALIPNGLELELASTITLGAIAMQGVRRAQPTIGETFIVIGLGILGQLTTQLLKVNGCRTIGIDIDRNRISIAKNLGMQIGLHPDDGEEIEQISRLTDGLGADGVIITAASPSDEIISKAFKICRKKGRVVLVGDVGLHLNRSDFYSKEIDFFISASYGPGRYDRKYEEEGLDYPAAYVRWTENRNMVEYLRLLSEHRLNIAPMITAKYPIIEATSAYFSISNDHAKPLLILLTYPTFNEEPKRTIKIDHIKTTSSQKIRIAVIGAGGFARSSHLPNLNALRQEFSLQAVVTKNGHNAKIIAKKFKASYASTDYKEILEDQNIDAVIIATHHHMHAKLALDALKSGKHVLVEKPLVLSNEELILLDDYINNSTNTIQPVLLTGYNRRFSPYAQQLYAILENRVSPFIINYRMNAGYIPLDHWVHGNEGGGRNLGEACHIYDLFTFLTNSKVTSINVQKIKPKTNYYSHSDNFITSMSFADGSIASLTYTSLGNNKVPKEIADIYVDGKIFTLNDYKRLDVYGVKNKSMNTHFQDKGLLNELKAFASAITSGTWPIPWWQQVQSAKIALTVDEYLNSNQ